jgi:hypothetical protein
MRWPAAAEIHLKGGGVVATRIEFASGEPENPLSRAALVDKFVGLAAGSIAQPEALAQRILSIADEPDVRGVAAALRSAS